MERLHKLFFEQKMTWIKVLLFAVATAVVTAGVMLIPALENTSFQNIGITVESWILFALIIIINCHSPWEAGLKTFVFFLVSQPLIYLLQMPFGLTWDRILLYYPRWGFMTLLCLPGGMIAWLVKKDNLLSAFVLSVATGILAAMSAYFAVTSIRDFPQFLLSAIYCGALIVLFILVLLQNKRNRIITGVISLVVFILMATYSLGFTTNVTKTNNYYELDPAHTWEIVTPAEESIFECSVSDEEPPLFEANAAVYGTQEVTLINEDGETLVLVLEYEKGTTNLKISEKQD